MQTELTHISFIALVAALAYIVLVICDTAPFVPTITAA